MNNIDEFYEESKALNRPSPLLRGFFNMNLDKELKGKVAIDLGAGAGNDAEFLIHNGFKVTCVDKEEKSRKIIEERITNTDNLKFIVKDFEDIKLHKADLIYSCFSLHFCNPTKFDKLMSEIIRNIIPGGYFVR